MCSRNLKKALVFCVALVLVLQSAMASWPVRESKLPKVETVVEVKPVVAVAEVELVEEAPVVEESLQTESTPSEVTLLEKELSLSKQELENLKAEVEEFKNYKNEQKVSEIKDAIDTIVLGVELKEEAFKAEQARADEAESALAKAIALNDKLIAERNKLGILIGFDGSYNLTSQKWGAKIDLGFVKNGFLIKTGVKKDVRTFTDFTTFDDYEVSFGFGFIL